MDSLEKIKFLLNDSHMKQVDLANALGVTQSTISLWLKKKSTSYTRYFVELSHIFNVPVDYFIEDSYTDNDKVIALWNKLSDKQKFLVYSLILDIVKDEK